MSAKKSQVVPPNIEPGSRVFKTAKFTAQATRRKIRDAELCGAIAAVQASSSTYSLGGEVYKKRLNNNLDRSIVLAKGGRHWFYAHLFQKSDADNISDKELQVFRKAAKELGKLTGGDLDAAVAAGKLWEICNEKAK